MDARQSELVEQHMYIATQEAKRWRHLPIEQEDLVQEGLIGLCRAALKFDESYNVPFKVIARIKVRGYIVDVIKKRVRKNTIDRTAAREDREYYNTINFSTMEYDTDGDRELNIADVKSASPEDRPEFMDNLQILDGMPQKEKYLLVRMAVDGAGLQEIADELGIGYSAAQNLSSKATKRIRKRVEKSVG